MRKPLDLSAFFLGLNYALSIFFGAPLLPAIHSTRADFIYSTRYSTTKLFPISFKIEFQPIQFSERVNPKIQAAKPKSFAANSLFQKRTVNSIPN